MQTTLLGIAIALILALVAALVGPYVVDWNRYRAAFETEASRIVGAPVRISGPIEASLLPNPSLSLHSVEAAAGGAAFSARAVRFEIALGPLMRGEWRVSELWMSAPQLRVGVDAAGRLQAPGLARSFDPDRFAIDRIAVERGRIVIADERRKSALALDNLAFQGELRSLAGPLRGDGSFASTSGFYRFRIATGRGGGEGLRLRANLEAADRPLLAEADGVVRIEQANPRYEGALTVARPAGVALSDGRRLAREPWRVAAQVKADPARALAEGIEFQYGPDDRPLRLTGQAKLALGESPRFDAALGGHQIDLDRMIGTPDPSRHASAAALLGSVKTLFEAVRAPMRGRLDLDIDALTLGGVVLNSLHGAVGLDSDHWDIEALDFRAPGLTQVSLSGRLEAKQTNLEFAGPASIESNDPKVLLAFIEGEGDAPRGPVAPVRASGDLVIGDKGIVVDRLRAEVDHKPIEGRIAYAAADPGGGPARLDATLRADEIDLDGALAIAKGAFSGAKLERPRTMALALSVGKLSYGDVQASRVEAKLKLDASGLTLDRFSIGDIGGASVKATGLFDTSSTSPQGAGSLVLSAPGATGLIALAERFAPRLAVPMRQSSAQLAPAELRARLELAPAKGTSSGGGAAARTQAQLAIDGKFGAIRLNALANAVGDPASLGAATVTFDGSVKSENGKVLATLVGIDRAAAIDSRPAAISLNAKGPLDGDMAFDLRLAAGGLSGSAAGLAGFRTGEISGQGNAALNASDARPLINASGRAALPVTLDSKVVFSGRRLKFESVNARIAGSGVGGRLNLELASPLVMDGGIQATEIDAGQVIAALVGAPKRTAARGETGGWAAEPFARPLFDDLKGDIAFEAGRADILPGLVAQNLKGRASFGGSSLALEELVGSLAGGALTGNATFGAGPAGRLARLQLDLAKADLAQITFGRSRPPASGSVSLAIAVEGSGLSPAALIGALQGTGTLAVEGVQLAGLDPKAMDAAIRAADRGLAIERLPAYLAPLLDAGRIAIPAATSTLAVLDGRIRTVPVIVSVDGMDTEISGTFNIADNTLDARVSLIGAPREEVKGRRPELSILWNGPLSSPKREIDTTELASFVTLRAVERESKRVEAAEREAKRREEAAIAVEQAERERIERERASQASQRAEPAPSQTGSAARPPVLPPPVEIKPQPIKPARAAKPTPPPPPQPPPSRSLWDGFWGRP